MLIGQEKIIKSFKKMKKDGRVVHSFILNGEEGLPKKELSKRFVREILDLKEDYNIKNHPDVKYIKEEKRKTLGIDKIREELVKDINIKPYKAKNKIYIIEKADTMTIQAQNTVLKTIEEPPGYAIIILLSNNYNVFLETILSRCMLYKLKRVNKDMLAEVLNIKGEKLEFVNAYSRGNIGKANQILNSDEYFDKRNGIIEIIYNIKDLDLTETIKNEDFFIDNKDEINEILDIINIIYRDVYVYKLGLDKMINKDKKEEIIKISKEITFIELEKNFESIIETKKFLKYNANFKLTIEILLLKLKGEI